MTNFQIEVANGLLEKLKATTTLKIDIGDKIFAEHFVVMKNLTGPIIGLHIMRQEWGHRHYTWPHPFPTLDKESRKCTERNKY